MTNRIDSCYYKYIVVILVYRNTEDLRECIASVNKNIASAKIIVVNAFYDENSLEQIKSIALEQKCDFIGIENNGYSYGNNQGIQFAMSKYSFDYIIISNPDIVIKCFDDINMPDADVIAPKIVSASGKNQNPMVVRENKISEYFVYKGLKNNKKFLFGLGIIFNKVGNIYGLERKTNNEIFAAHGSFVIIKKKVVELIQPLYDNNIFLFAEEGVLAYRCREHGFKTQYYDSIVVNHKEDGCMKLADFSINNELKKSNTYFYENYISRNKKHKID